MRGIGAGAIALLEVEGGVAAGQVGAGAEGPARARDDHGTHVVVGIGGVERGDQLMHHLRGERIELVRAVQGDGGDTVFNGVAQGFERRRGLRHWGAPAGIAANKGGRVPARAAGTGLGQH
ncbi:hypothetical protein D9M72_459050 [compost metagenome]